MKQLAFILTLVIASTSAAAHSGRTDSSGGHNCSQSSKNKGLCSGYHYHKYGKNEVKCHIDHSLEDEDSRDIKHELTHQHKKGIS